MIKNKNRIVNEFGRFASYENDEDAFYRWVDRDLPTNECWNWKGCKDKNGYGRLTVNRKDRRAHRISWSLINGEIPKGMFICHRCDNPSCVNPDHLFIGTGKDNSDDMISKGRNSVLKGKMNPAAKLDEYDVMEIRKWAASGMRHGIIAYNFGVSKLYISAIVNGKTWKHITEGKDAINESNCIGRSGTG